MKPINSSSNGQSQIETPAGKELSAAALNRVDDTFETPLPKVSGNSADLGQAELPFTICEYLSTRLPPKTAEAQAALEESIRLDGIQRPYVVWNGKLVDGLHREKARQILLAKGITVSAPTLITKHFESEAEAVCWMYTNQDAADRPWSTFHKIAAIQADTRLLTGLKEIAAKRQALGLKSDEGTADVLETIGKMAGISRSTVGRMMAVLDNEQATKSVEKGELSANKAYETFCAKGKETKKQARSQEQLEAAVLKVLQNEKMAERVADSRITVEQAATSIDRRHKKIVDTLKAEIAGTKLPTFDANGVINGVHECDALEGLKALADGMIDLTVTSPPYPINFKFYRYWDYEKLFQCNYSTYLAWIEQIFTELYRVTKDGGRLVVNIDNCYDASKATGPRQRLNCYRDFCNIAEKLGWTFEGDYNWYKQNCVSNRVLMGSKELVRGQRNFEYLLVWYKGTPQPIDESKYDLTPKQRAKYSIASWHIPPVKKSQKRKGTAPFPLPLPSRVIKLHSLRGQVVLDPFNGSGTTITAAALLGRQYIGFELDEELVNYSQKRVARAIEKAKEKAAQPIDLKKVIKEASFKSGTKEFIDAEHYISLPTASITMTEDEVQRLLEELQADTDTASNSL